MTRLASMAFLSVFLAAAGVRALTPQEILIRSDELLTKVQDQKYDATMTIFEAGKKIKTIDMSIVLKGLYKKLIRFSSPSDVKGMAVLTLENNVMYVYMPAFKKIRRVATHVRKQSFFGSDFDYDDMSQSAFSAFYQASLLKETDAAWILKLVPKPGSTAAWPRLDVTIRKADFVNTEIVSYSENGEKIKTQKRSNHEMHGGFPLCKRIEIISHTANHSSVLEFSNIRSNTDVKDRVFEKRNLMRGE